MKKTNILFILNLNKLNYGTQTFSLEGLKLNGGPRAKAHTYRTVLLKINWLTSRAKCHSQIKKNELDFGWKDGANSLQWDKT